MSWSQLISIKKEAEDIRRQEAQRPPVACPLCGEPLTTGPHGELFCRFCGWRHGS